MKKKNNLIASVIILLGLSVCSCQKGEDLILDDSTSKTQKGFDAKLVSKYQSNYTDENIKSDYTVIDGTIHFKNQESFKKVMNNLDEFKKDIKEYKNFISSEEYLRNLMTSLAKSKTVSQRNEIFQQNLDYLVDIDGIIAPKKNCFVTPFTDKNGSYFIGKVIILLNADSQFIIYDGDKNKISSIKSGVIPNGVVQKISTNSPRAKMSRSCGFLSGELTTGNYIARVSVDGGTFVSPFPNNDGKFDSFVYVSTSANSWLKVPLYSQFGTILFITYENAPTNNNLLINYKASLIIFGTVVNSTEPNFMISTFDSHVYNWQVFGTRSVTQDEINNTQGQINVVIEERGGYYSNGNVNGNAVYRCN